MKSKDLKPLKVSLHGMDERMQKMMANYLKLACKGIAVIVDDDEALAEIVDVDLSLSKTLLEDRLENQPSKPIIALSLNDIPPSKVIYVKKPIQVPDVLAAIGVAKDVILGKTELKETEPAKKPVIKQEKSKQHQAKPATKKPVQKPKPDFSDKPEPGRSELESSKDVSDFITEAMQKSAASKKTAHGKGILDDTLKDKISNDKSPPVEIAQQPKVTEEKKEVTPDQKVTNIVSIETEALAEEKAPAQDKKIEPSSVPAFLKQDEISVKPTTIERSVKNKKPVKKPKKTKAFSPKNTAKETTAKTNQEITSEAEIAVDKITATQAEQKVTEPTKPVVIEKPAARPINFQFTRLFDTLWQSKGLIAGLTCLFSIIMGIYIFQITPLYEAKSRIFIGTSNSKNLDQNASNPEDTLDTAVAQSKINEIKSRLLAGRVINILELNTIPEFVAASVVPDTSETSSELRQERKADEQLAKISDYFLQNLSVSQFKNTPIINISYQAENPELAYKIVNQLVEEYLALQQDKTQELAAELADWETNKLPAAKNKLKQSQDALALYIEMNKWSQFEQQFAEDMGVNSEIRALEKKVKADLSLYQILLKRFENLKQESDALEARLVSAAELPIEPSYPNRQRLLLLSLLSATLISIVIAFILPLLNFRGKKVIGEPI